MIDLIQLGIEKMLQLDEARQRTGCEPITPDEQEASDTIAILRLWGQGYAGPTEGEGQ
jgi:hypothetical protein